MREKILFFILGGLLATIAYSIGDNRSNAQDIQMGVARFDEIHCHSLRVFGGELQVLGKIECDSIRIMDSIHKSGVISLNFNEGEGPSIILANMNDNGGVIKIAAEENGASFRMMTSDQVLHEIAERGLFVLVDNDGTGISAEGKLEMIHPEE